jgi:hypothetical protein
VDLRIERPGFFFLKKEGIVGSGWSIHTIHSAVFYSSLFLMVPRRLFMADKVLAMSCTMSRSASGSTKGNPMPGKRSQTFRVHKSIMDPPFAMTDGPAVGKAIIWRLISALSSSYVTLRESLSSNEYDF